MKKRNFLVALCSVLALSCVSLGGITAKTNASATATTTFEMKYGASARTVSGESGLRFQTIVDKATADEVVADTTRSFGMIIVPTDYLAGITDNFVPALETLCADNENVTLTKIETNNLDEEIVPYLDEDGNYYFNGVIDVSYNNTNRDFTGIAYIKTVNADETVSYEYAAFAKAEDGAGAADVKNNSRSIAEIASAALNETIEEYKVTGTRREVCVSYVNDALTRAAKLEQGADIEGLFALDGETALAPNGETTLELAQAADLRLNWSSSDEVVATVNGGKVTVGAYVGQTTVTASIGNDETTDFAATKDVISKAATGTFKWTENSISTVASRYDAYAAKNANPAYIEQTEIDGVNVIEVKAGAKASQPTVLFNNADCFFNLSAGSVITFKVGLSAGFYSDGGWGGVAITYKDAPAPDTSDFTEAEFNEKLYVSATSEATDLTLGYANATVNGQRQKLYKAALAATTGTSEIKWIDFSLSFPSTTVATLENLMITFASHNFDIRNDAQVESNKIYVSNITVTEKVDKTKLTYFGTSLQGIDGNGTTNSYPANLSVVTEAGKEAVKVAFNEDYVSAASDTQSFPGVQFVGDEIALTQNSVVSFYIRISDGFMSSGGVGGIFITYDGITLDTLSGAGGMYGFASSITAEGNLTESNTKTMGYGIRTVAGVRHKAFLGELNEHIPSSAGNLTDCQWMKITITFTNVANPTLNGLRIMFNTRANGTFAYNRSADLGSYILISDLTVTNP